jgi:hypothetical protein
MNGVTEQTPESRPAAAAPPKRDRSKKATTKTEQTGPLCVFAIGEIGKDGLPVLNQGFEEESAAIKAAYKQDTPYYKIERYVAKEEEQENSSAVMLIGVKAS